MMNEALVPVIARAQNGEPEALAGLTFLIRPHVARQLARYPLGDDDRADVLQTTLMQVVRRISSFKGNSSFSTWLFRVTANEALMLMRSQRRQRARLAEGVDLEDIRASDTTTPGSGTDGAVLEGERDGLVRAAVAKLPDHYRAVVTAHYDQDLGLHEIADRLKLSESAVRSRLHRARARLRTMLDGQAQVAA